MTEIQWLCDVLVTCKMSSSLKDRFIARIGEVTSTPQPVILNRPNVLQQAPSTQRILDEMNSSPAIPMRAPTPLPERIDKETGRAMVATGKGTSGPRKF